MTAVECPREQDVLDALTSRRWPARCDDELRAHIAACPVCGDLVEVAAALLDARDVADERPEVPPASLVWWRAQLRAREEAARLAERPLRLARVAAVSCGALVAIIALQAILPALWGWVPVALAWRPPISPDAATGAITAALANRGVQLAAVAWLVLGPVAVYLALARD